MSKSKKTIITLSIVCVVALIVLVTVVSVWAATSQTVTNQLTVRYTATNVSATVKADYQLAGSSTWQSMGSASFGASENSTSKSLTAKEIELSDTATYVIFRYTFTNNGSNTITVSLDQNNLPTAKNITVQYAFSPLFFTSNSINDQNMPTYQANKNYSAIELDPDSLPWTGSVNIEGNKTDEVYIKVSITSQASDASYSGTLSWNLKNYQRGDHQGGST